MTELNFPSWTWLSCPGKVKFEPAASMLRIHVAEIPRAFENHVNIVDWHVVWQGHPLTSKLTSTRLIVKGAVQDLFIEIPAEARTFKPPYCIINHKISKGSDSPIPWRSTMQFDRDEWKPAKTWTCLLLQSTTYPDEQSTRREDTFLLIEPVSSGRGFDTFIRVGIGISMMIAMPSARLCSEPCTMA